MSRNNRIKTNYPGVFYVEGTAIGNRKPERIYYIRYRRNERMIEEKAGRQFQDDMTPARAAHIRTKRIEGNQLSNRERREVEIALKESEKNKWTIERLWNEYKAINPNLKGIIQDENRYQVHIKPDFGEREPKDICSLDIDKLRIKLQKTKRRSSEKNKVTDAEMNIIKPAKTLSPATINNILELLRRICNFGAEKHLCPGLSFVIKLPQVNNIKTEQLSDEEISRLLAVIAEEDNIQAGNMMLMALYTGMRRSELFRLQWQDIDYGHGFIHLRDPKGGSDQIIPLNDQSRRLLETHPRSISSFVFPGRDGNQRRDIKNQVNKIKTKAGIPVDFRALHGLRHVFASLLASSGQVDLYTLQKLLTHKSPIMTQRYAHLRNETLKRAANLLEKLIGGAKERKKLVQV